MAFCTQISIAVQGHQSRPPGSGIGHAVIVDAVEIPGKTVVRALIQGGALHTNAKTSAPQIQHLPRLAAKINAGRRIQLHTTFRADAELIAACGGKYWPEESALRIGPNKA